MREPTRIISMIKINGEWVNQDDLPKETVRAIVQETITRAAENIGFVPTIRDAHETKPITH